jgi:hypothetical protein
MFIGLMNKKENFRVTYQSLIPRYLSPGASDYFFDSLLEFAVGQGIIEHRETADKGKRFENGTRWQTVNLRYLSRLKNPGCPVIPYREIPVSLGIPDLLNNILC